MEQNNFILITCPHCKAVSQVAIKDINCRIFRHGVYKSTFKPIDPHTPKVICDALKARDLIYGCGKPFRLIWIEGNVGHVVGCDYI
jgi:hypothetical protein